MKFEKEKIFLSTTLPYVNSSPHQGHAFEFILGDAIARRLRSQGKHVRFNVGLDEHGLKVYQKAIELGITPEEHVRLLTTRWEEFCKKLCVDYDVFYKTSSIAHVKHVQETIDIIFAQQDEGADIYPGEYEGVYCIGCESYKKDKDLVEDRCPDHPNLELIHIKEKNWYFRLSRFKESLLKWLEVGEPIKPASKKKELINFVNDIEDLSISRKWEDCPWGVIFPEDEEHVVYVWFDALLNYLFAAGWKPVGKHDGITWNDWDRRIQLCGPDNLRFQGGIFQSILACLSQKPTDKILVHGTILAEDGSKMSKSQGNVVDPVEQINRYGVEAVRFYSIAILSTYGNSKWNEVDLVNTYNSIVCDGWGNLIARVLHLVDTKCGGDLTAPDDVFKWAVDDLIVAVDKAWEDFDINEAYKTVSSIISFANEYINEHKPWKLDFPKQVLSNLYYLLGELNEQFVPIFEHKCEEVRDALDAKKKKIIFSRIELKQHEEK